MDYYEEGQKVKKLYGNINKARDFEKYVYDFLFNNAHEFQKAEFVRGMLSKTRNETLFIYAKDVANRTEKSESIWSEILYAFNLLVKGKTKPKWAFSFMSSIINNSKLKLHNYDVRKLVFAMLKYDGEGSAWWFDKGYDQPWFKEYSDYMKTALVELVNEINPKKADQLFNVFPDMFFYTQLVDAHNSPTLFGTMLNAIRRYEKQINGFHGGFTIDDILKTYPERFAGSADSVNDITSLIKKYSTPDTGELLVTMLDKAKFVDESNINWLWKVESEINDNSNAIKNKLYELTGDEKYLSDEAKDIFLF